MGWREGRDGVDRGREGGQTEKGSVTLAVEGGGGMERQREGETERGGWGRGRGSGREGQREGGDRWVGEMEGVRKVVR
jgi:hypothetical protein